MLRKGSKNKKKTYIELLWRGTNGDLAIVLSIGIVGENFRVTIGAEADTMIIENGRFQWRLNFDESITKRLTGLERNSKQFGTMVVMVMMMVVVMVIIRAVRADHRREKPQQGEHRECELHCLRLRFEIRSSNKKRMRIFCEQN